MTLYVSPRLRAQQTATAIVANRANALVETDPAFDEVDFGDWSGRSFESLNGDEDWRQWNVERSRARAPRGESIHDVAGRVIARVERLSELYEGRRVAVVTHAEVIRTIVFHYLGVSLNAWWLLEVHPASITTLVLGGQRPSLVAVNERVYR